MSSMDNKNFGKKIKKALQTYHDLFEQPCTHIHVTPAAGNYLRLRLAKADKLPTTPTSHLEGVPIILNQDCPDSTIILCSLKHTGEIRFPI